jgi:hypothetical protein
MTNRPGGYEGRRGIARAAADQRGPSAIPSGPTGGRKERILGFRHGALTGNVLCPARFKPLADLLLQALRHLSQRSPATSGSDITPKTVRSEVLRGFPPHPGAARPHRHFSLGPT